MERIGKYNGIDCYVCTDTEYKNKLKDCDDGQYIYIIDGTMVRRNRIIGHYDGRNVRDRYDGVPYVVECKPGPQKEMKPIKVSDAVGVESKDINFADYSKIVDEFFANLDK